MAKDDITHDYEAETGETKQESAVRRLTHLFDQYKAEGGGNEDEQTHFADLLADLMHFANATHEGDEDFAIDFDAALSTAQMHFSAESDDDDDQEDKDWWEVTYTLDGKQESTQVVADDEAMARYYAQAAFGSPIEITKVDKI